MTETNSLVYVATELITAVKIFILKAQGEPGIFKAKPAACPVKLFTAIINSET